MSAMKVWIVCVFILFALVEFYQWLKHLHLPLPWSIFGGIVLAFASNYRFFKLELGEHVSETRPTVRSANAAMFSSQEELGPEPKFRQSQK